jgi:hypothetical protein
VNALTLPVYHDLPVIVWREMGHSLGNINYLHQQGPISFRKLMGGCLLERQRSVLLAEQAELVSQFRCFGWLAVEKAAIPAPQDRVVYCCGATSICKD